MYMYIIRKNNDIEQRVRLFMMLRKVSYFLPVILEVLWHENDFEITKKIFSSQMENLPFINVISALKLAKFQNSAVNSVSFEPDDKNIS